MSDDIRRNLALFPIGIVQKLTELTARQIRYYESNKLISPVRTEGNQRLFSFNDVERLLDIKRLIDQGLNIAGIKKVLGSPEATSQLPNPESPKDVQLEKEVAELSDKDLHQLLKQEIFMRRPGASGSLIQGELSRFFH